MKKKKGKQKRIKKKRTLYTGQGLTSKKEGSEEMFYLTTHSIHLITVI